VVLDLQGDLEIVDRALQAAHSTIQASSASSTTLNAMASLQRTHTRLVEKVEGLYSSLQVTERFPELRGVDFEFIRTLLLARDLKVNIRKRAIGSFFEWERLDQAVGGKSQALGEWGAIITTACRSLIKKHLRHQTAPTHPECHCEMKACTYKCHP
jgi:hypothetical protein